MCLSLETVICVAKVCNFYALCPDFISMESEFLL